MNREVYLTTEDNPFNPSTDFDKWFAFDEEQGYHSCGLLARVALVSDDLSEADQVRAIESAIDKIVEINPFGNHKKLVVA